MRNIILALVAGATLGVSGMCAEAMPVAGAPGAVTPTANVEKTVVIVRRTIIRRPPRRVCTTRIGPFGRRTTVCR